MLVSNSVLSVVICPAPAAAERRAIQNSGDASRRKGPAEGALSPA